MSDVQVVCAKPVPDYDGCLLNMPPRPDAGIPVGFEIYRMQPGQKMIRETGNSEVCILILGGKADVVTKKDMWMQLGDRADIFDKKPPCLAYVPHHNYFEVDALTGLEIAICSVPGSSGVSSALFRPEDMETVATDDGVLLREFITPGLVVREMYAPPGGWVGYSLNDREKTMAEKQHVHRQICYFRSNPAGGFAVQLFGCTPEEAVVVNDGDVAVWPEGRLLLAVPPNMEMYQLNFICKDQPVRKPKRGE